MAILGVDLSQLGSESMLEDIRRTAQQRLRQIAPLLEEAERLRDVLALLEKESPKPGTAAQRLASQPQPRAAKGSNKRLILELVGRTPGITAAEISTATGVKRTVVASTVSRLKRQGELRDHERGGVCLTGETAGSIASPAPPSSRQRR